MNRCPEVYFIGPPAKNGGKVHWLMYAKIPPYKRPIMLVADMPDTAIISHTELLNTMVSEIYDEVKAIKSGKKTPPDSPYEENFQPLSWEGQKVFDSDDIQYYVPGAPNTKGGIILP